MSLVGPRPWPLSMVDDQVAGGDRYRIQIRAGWTGPAQVQKGPPTRSATPALDGHTSRPAARGEPWRLVRYDLGILRETARVLLRGEGLKY